ncbi:SDR family NAD(P)-dependent oxidoreductase [Kocuria coralli]|uniref:SDR family NAD(P)-dependent oxidoreductase n=1 Tax=Kocuria coralli TaxID=1461025 RepID=A0A5J5L110_9MICC|nr:SDR family NAD(P)-dependent oxidoreductase [Kocuria coralli]KAA9394885.1 SDR family NAD(P)-dependent oxidoreductase [Kocuria coralli]
MRNFLPPLSLPDQTGRTWLVTGATNGLGKETARDASRAGARVIVAARNEQRGSELVSELGNARLLRVDLAELASVHAAAAALDEPVDVLVNNAGAVAGSREETADGFELMLGTNALGPFAFTNLILPWVKDRIVIVASGAHRWVEMDFDDPHFLRRRFSFTSAYGQSKLADMLWGLGLSRRLTRAADHEGAPRRAVQLVHPGWVQTNLQNHSPSQVFNKFVTVSANFGGQSASDGAQNSLIAATRDLPECSYVGPGRRGQLKGAPSLLGRSPHASNPELADAFWTFAEGETGTQLPAFTG